jgi:flagellar biosynthesis protein FlhF
MRLKTFLCRNMKEALTLIKHEMGPDAIIISSMRDGKGVRVTAAMDEETLPSPVQPPLDIQIAQGINSFFQLLEYHNVPEPLRQALSEKLGAMPRSALVRGMTSILLALMHFQSGFFQEKKGHQTISQNRLVLAGPSGAGKTVTLAKLAAEALMAGKSVDLITCDTLKAGGSEQLGYYAKALNVPMHVCSTTAELLAQLQHIDSRHMILIDTPGINPLNLNDFYRVVDLILALKQAPILVVPAGMDVFETLEMIDLFKNLGTTKMIGTRLDAAKRHGNILASLFCGQLELVGLSAGPSLGDRLQPGSAESLLKLCHIPTQDPSLVKTMEQTTTIPNPTYSQEARA